jgi:hypothetical protein
MVDRELAMLLLRNTVASWLVNTEFFAPLLLWIYAMKRRRSHPRLTRFVRLPVIVLLLAGLLRQIHEQWLLPLRLLASGQGIEPGTALMTGIRIAYALLLVAGYGGLLLAVYYRRSVTPVEDPFNERGRRI